ncbi:RHS repeat-associated core domain-containing protein [Aureispira sp. CCB-QB1]|uniref:RHS repeat-associated core domain-containing protein n=1 Tax=Aureispira sp. CCB-QB1 TaxID=1313421 RepID=UPI000695BA63|nr:RHS repeat-associated core domain-containing protein [Aureispira sp. CCB-QB1]
MKYINCFLIFFLLLLQSQAVFAEEEEYLASLKGSNITPNANLVGEDAWYNYMQSFTDWEDRLISSSKEAPYDLSKKFTNISMDSYLSFRWEGSENIVFTDNWSYRVEVMIQPWNTKGEPMPVVTRWLSIDYKVDRQENFKDWDVFHIPNAARLVVKVLNIEYTDLNGTVATPSHVPLMKEDLYLEAKVKVKRVFSLDLEESLNIIQENLNLTERTVTYTWNHAEGAEEYDFEWLYLSEDVNAPVNLSDPQIANSIWKRATRVSLNHNYYKIELPYDEGKVYFRVRAVGYGNELNHRLIGVWDYSASPVSILDSGGDLLPLEKNKNWTYQASYAEQGKRVEVLNFADGTGRARQSVTKDNSYQRSIVSETVFDREGRQAIQIIPSVAKAIDNQLKFFERYNIVEGIDQNGLPTVGNPIHWTDFDTDEHYTFDALQETMELSTFAGSSRYFSGANNDKNNEGAAFIADAKKYPYTQTVFDNQGRVKLQSGVGETHRFGTKHATEYHYATAFQEDLDELFGSEIGYSQHYSMQMTKDPNGQLSISYTNLSGQTIATALLGNVPKDANQNGLVDPLDGSLYRYPTERIKTRDLIPSSELKKNRLSNARVIRKEFMVTSPGDYDFHYQVNVSSFTGCDGVAVPCDFELMFNMYDSEGNVLNGQLIPNSTMVFGEFFDVENGDVFDFKFVAGINNLKSYTIEKILRLKNIADKVEAHKAILTAANQTYMQGLAAYYEDPENLSPPTYTESNCIDVAPWLSDYPNNCENYDSDPTSLGCEGIKSLLKADMLPGGQYYDASNWLEDHITSPFPINYQNVSYPDWASIRNLTYIEVEEIMTQNNLFEYHPEWCLYAYQCVDNPINGQTWYQALRQQDADWLAMDAATANNLGYLTIPTNGMCVQGTNGNTGYWGNINYPMLAAVRGITSTYFANPAVLEDHIKYDMCQFVSDGTNNFDIGQLARLADANVPIEEKWDAIRSMMIESKRRGMNEHIIKEAICGSFLGDADPNDGMYVDDKGFSIRIPDYYDVITQTETQTGLNITTAGSNSHGDIQNIANQILNQNVVFTGGPCTVYEAVINYNCYLLGDHPASNEELTIDINFSDPSLIALYGSSINVLPTVYFANAICNVGSLQGQINNKIASFPSPLSNDLSAIVTKKNDQIYIKFYLPTSNPNYYNVSFNWTLLQRYENTNNTSISNNTEAIGYANCKTKDLNLLCDYYKLVDIIDCPNDGTSIDLTLYSSSSTSAFSTTYGTTPLSLGTITAGMLGSNCNNDLSMLQATLNAAVNSLPSPLKDDLILFARQGNNGTIELVVKLPSLEVDVNGQIYSTSTYDNVVLGTTIHTPSLPDVVNSYNIEYFSCNDQNYTTCICEEISALKEQYNQALPSGYTTVYQAIAARYSSDLGFPVSVTDVQFIENNYCSSSSVLSYPLGSFQDLQDWKAAFKIETGINSNFRNELAKCLEISSPLSCEEEAIALALFHAEEYLNKKTTEAVARYRESLKTDCVDNLVEEFTLTYTDRALHYTLYYYDASGNLVQTVPPTGVDMLESSAELLAANGRRKGHKLNPSAPAEEPAHEMKTTYKYNTLNEVLESTAPDRGTVRTYYDKLGRPVLSQNAQQVVDKTANYITYDGLGRVTETGVIAENANPPAGKFLLTFSGLLDPNNLISFQSMLDDNIARSLHGWAGWTKSEVRSTFYNEGIPSLDSKFENEVGLRRNRVGGQSYSMDGQTIDYQIAYNYDVFGNAKEVWQFYPQLLGNSYKKLLYDYDLISGVVHQVDYQKGEKDQLSFKYSYDANNRLIKAKSSLNGFIWNTEAKYEYYYHGPLKRVELGEDKVQGLDYLYTMHGWIKGVNSNKLNENYDPGRDGNKNSTLHANIGADVHGRIAKDVFGYTVHYYDNDFVAINTNVQDFSEVPTLNQTGNLYNGNISSVTQAQTKPQIDGVNVQEALPSIWKKYRYDQLHRLVKAQTLERSLGAAWGPFPPSGKFDPPTGLQTEYQYGPNGNILNLKRYVNSAPNTFPILLDDLTYHYNAGQATLATDPKNFVNNKLSTVREASTQSTRTDDLKDMVNNDNYVYDKNGSLIEDKGEYIESIEWTSEQKVRYVKRPNTNPENRPDLEYVYDFQGNRISKTQIPNVSGAPEKHTIYVRDPQGNVLGVYEYEKEVGQVASTIYNTPTVYLKEQMLYGSDRLGIIKRNVQTGGPAKILGDGTQILSTVTPKNMISSYWENIESDNTFSYSDFNQVRDEGFDISKVLDLKNLSITAKDQLYFKSFPIFTKDEAVLQRMERIRGNHRYELKNFRGDVRQIITDVKLGEDTNADAIADVYTANVVQVTDGYSFGWDIVERTFTVDDHRFGFNGKENDKDWGNQLIQDYGFRLYNPAIAKFLSVDPLAPEYPELTTYQFASNRPIDGIDLDGLEWKEIKRAFYVAGKKGTELVINTAGGVVYAVVHPINTGKAIIEETKETAKDIGTIYGTGAQIFSNHFFETEFEIDRETFYDAAQNTGKRIVENGGSTIIFGGMLSSAKHMAKGSRAKLFSGVPLDFRSTGYGTTRIYHSGIQIGEHTWNPKTSSVNIEINLPEHLQGKGIGKEIFKDAVEDVNQFNAQWVKSDRLYPEKGMSDNLIQYNKNIENKMTPEAAAWNTWSGRQAKENGFTTVKVTATENGVNAVFTR